MKCPVPFRPQGVSQDIVLAADSDEDWSTFLYFCQNTTTTVRDLSRNMTVENKMEIITVMELPLPIVTMRKDLLEYSNTGI